MTEDELISIIRSTVAEALTEQDIKRIIRETVEETLTTLGIEHDSPLEMQKDFRHLRDWRESVEEVRTKSFLAAIGILVAGAIGALWIGIKAILTGSPQ